MIKKYKFTYILAAIAVAMVLIFSIASGGARYAYAATAMSTAFEQSNVLDDLKGSTIDGEPFSLEDYNFDHTKGTQLLSFVEFCYSPYTNLQQDYGLYVYIYNPQGLNYATGNPLNKISLRYGGNESDKYVKYNLKFLNQSTDESYEGLFYKFKVVMSDSQRTNILKKVDSDNRIYEVSEIELLITGDFTATAIEVVSKYTFMGFVEGYGPIGNTDSLTWTADNYKDYLNLEVHHTYYRPEGDYYNGNQSQLNSCYFRVPERYFTNYGELYKIACEWYEYVTQPILITESRSLYLHLNNLHGADVSNLSNFYFLLAGFGNTDTSWFGNSTEHLGFISNYTPYQALTPLLEVFTLSDVQFYNFAAVFLADNYKTRYVSSEDVLAQLQLNSEYLGGPYVNGVYSKGLFTNYVDDSHTRGFNYKEISKDDIYDVFWNTTTKSFWQKIFGGYSVSTKFDSMKAIEVFTANDFKTTDREIATRFYIREEEVPNLRAEFEKCNNERLVLLRYGSSEYRSIKCRSTVAVGSDPSAKDFSTPYDEGYYAQETVYLDFDIISLTYKRDKVSVVIPVISSPQDVISDIQPPLKEHYGSGCNSSGFVMILIAIGSIIIAVLFVYFIIWINENVNQSKK